MLAVAGETQGKGCWMMAIRSCALALAASVAGLFFPAMAAPAASARATADSRMPLADVARSNCPPGLERYVPGEYYYCVGVRDLAGKKFARAREMLDDAARWGNKRAQFLLGVGYFKGDAGQLNRPLGLAYLQLASERGTPFYLAVYRSAVTQASVQEQAQASQLVRQMTPVYGDATAARRAELHYRHARSDLTDQAGFDEKVCIDGITGGKVPPLHPLKDQTVTVLCPAAQPVDRVLVRLDRYADRLLEGWVGRVTVGDVQPVAKPGK
ncbi:MAG TPA: hypothetical protein VFR91_06745 [Dyella sp.]|nr:hypothetical protein [Dyella sp.]